MPSALLTAFVAALASPAGDTLSCEVRGSVAWLASRASPLDSTEMRIGQSTAKICYSRPSARGRSVYDSLAPFGKLWRTGANEPTTLRLTSPTLVADVLLPAGRYVLHSVPDSTRWLFLFHTAEGTDPVTMFQSLKEVGRAHAAVERTPEHVEQFTIRAVADSIGNAFVMEWGTLRVRLPVRTP